MAPNVSEWQQDSTAWGVLCHHRAQRGSSHLFSTFNMGRGWGVGIMTGEGAEPSAGRWNGAFCQTCCIDHNGSQRELPFTAHCSQICAGNQEQPWFSCAAGVGEKRYLGGMREGTEKTWEISSTYFARTLQNSIHMSKSQHLCESSWVPFTDIESIKLIESGTQISLLLNSISKTIP